MSDEQPVFFKVGGEYRNKKGRYTVEQMDGDRLAVRYEDGTAATLSAETQQRIIQNMTLPPEVKGTGFDPDEISGYAPRMYKHTERWDSGRPRPPRSY